MAYMSVFCFIFSVRLGAIVTGIFGIVSPLIFKQI